MAGKPSLAARHRKMFSRHPIGELMWEKNWRNLPRLALCIGSHPKVVSKALKNPKKYFNIGQLEIIAFITDKTMIEIMKIVNDGKAWGIEQNYTRKDVDKMIMEGKMMWYENKEEPTS